MGPMSTQDRHGRSRRADNDLRRRPADGFRTADRARFARHIQQAVGGLPEDLRRHLAGVDLVIDDVPDPDLVLDDRVPLAELVLPAPGRAARLTVHRRAVELHARTRAELADELRRALAWAVTDALGLAPPDDEDD